MWREVAGHSLAPGNTVPILGINKAPRVSSIDHPPRREGDGLAREREAGRDADRAVSMLAGRARRRQEATGDVSLGRHRRAAGEADVLLHGATSCPPPPVGSVVLRNQE